MHIEDKKDESAPGLSEFWRVYYQKLFKVINMYSLKTA